MGFLEKALLWRRKRNEQPDRVSALDENTTIPDAIEHIDEIPQPIDLVLDNTVSVNEEEPEKNDTIIDNSTIEISDTDLDSALTDDAKPDQTENTADKHYTEIPEAVYPVVVDATRELLTTSSMQEFYNVFLLLVMGQLGCSSASIISPLKGEEELKWYLRDVRGVRVKSKMIVFRTIDPIMRSVLSENGLIDIESFVGNPECRQEYPLFSSINARYIFPLRSGTAALSALAIGSKLDGEEYTEEEMSIIGSLAASAGRIVDLHLQIETLTAENESIVERNKEYSDIENFEKEYRISFGADPSGDIFKKMNYYGIESYAFFSRSESGEFFDFVFGEREDFASFRENAFTVPYDSELVSHMIQFADWEEFENPTSSLALRSVFSESHILKMNICVLYPFVVGAHLLGFLVILRAKRERLVESKIHVMRLARTVFGNIMGRELIKIDEFPFIDPISKVYERIERTLHRSGEMKIPLSFVLFKVRNYKRYCALFGVHDSGELMKMIRNVIESRVSGNEFAVKLDRGVILTLLPGKTRKYAIPFAAAVQNEILSNFRERESHIMLTHLIAEYPTDGKTVNEIMDFID